MSQQNPTIIVGHLDDSELTKSIDKLVNEVANKTTTMAGHFTTAIGKMQDAMKDFAITQKVSVDLMKEAWRDMSKSFDAMVAAQSGATGGGKGSGKGKVYAPDTVGALEREISLLKEERREMQLGSDELRTQNQLLEQRSSRLKQETTSTEGNLLKAFKVRMGNVISLPSKTFSDANEKLRRLRELLDDMQKRPFLFNESQINRVKNAIDSVETKIERMRKKFGSQGTQPNTLQQVLGMDENSFDAISKKMAALKKLSWSDPIEQKRIIDEYQRLRQEQNKLMASNAKMTHSNNYLAQSFGYIRNRIVYALTLGAITSFVKQIYEVRGQYELLERSLGVLVNSFERGSQVFNELNQMAIESPFTLMELAGAAKQLTAYNFAANEVVDTTRRLADISAALGVPMERLTYNLGQIRAQTVLNARDARDFANAGLPIVKSLSDYYTELEGKIVSTGDVYDRMSKKMVSYNDVMAVLNKMTDEGGKFFEFQAKQAQTLRVQMANLTLAWNNMLNEMGRGNQGLLSLPVQGLKAMLQNWASLNRVLKNVVLSFGLLKLAQMVAIRYNWQLAASAGGTAKMMGFLGNAIKSVVASTRALFANPWTWVFVGIMAITDLIGKWRAARQEIAELNDELKENAKEAANSNFDFFYNKGNVETRKLANENKLTAEQGEKAWEAIEQQISTSAMSAKKLLGELWAIKDVNERVKKGFDYVVEINNAQAALQDLKDDTIKVSLDSGWWGIFGEGLTSDLKDYANQLNVIQGQLSKPSLYPWVQKLNEELEKGGQKLKDIDVYIKYLNSAGISEGAGADARTEFLKELDKTAESINNFIVAHKIKDPLQINEILERVRAVIKTKNPEIKGDLATLFDVELDKKMSELTKGAVDQNASLWSIFLDRLKHNYSSTFQGITNDIYKKNYKLSKEQQEAVDANLEYFKNTMPLYYGAIESMVSDASKLRINIGVTFGVQQLTAFQQEVNNRIAKASKVLDFGTEAMLPTQNDNLQTWVKTQQEAIKGLEEQNKLYKKDSSEWSKEQIKNNDKEIQQRKNLLDLFNQSYVKETKGKKRDPMLDTLKQTTDIVKKLQSEYDTLTKSGASSAEALDDVRKRYSRTINLLNKDLAKFGLPQLNLDMIKGRNPNDVLKYFQKISDILTNKGLSTLERQKAVEVVIQEFSLKAKTYNLDMITKGLNNELGKLKDEYELAVAIDADPELGNAFADMMGINVESLPHTVKEYADEYSKYLNKYLKGKNSALQFTGDELRGLTRDDITAFREQVDAGSFNQEWFDAIKKAYDDIQGKRKKDIDDTEKWKNSLIEKYGNLQDKLTKIYKDSVQNQVNAVKTFGTEDQKSDIVRLQLRLEATSDPAELTEINTEIAKIVKDVTDKNPIALKLVTASGNQTKADASKAYWEDFKNSELYAMTFEDMANNSTRAIQLIMDKLDGLKDKVKEDPASMKALIKSLEDAQKELNARDPFGGVARSLRDMANASQEARKAQEALWRAEVDIEKAQQEVDNAEDGTPEEQASAQQKLADAIQRRTTAQVKLTQAENKGKKAQENLKSSLQGISNQLGNVKELFDVVSKLFRAGGDDETADAIDAISEGFSIMTTVIMGVVAAMILLEASQPWLLAIAAALSVIVGLVSFLSGNENKKIDAKIKDSELAVKKLELAYIDLQKAVDKAYGTSVIGAKTAAAAAKKLELQELERQLRLERSRDSKYKDESRIVELQKQIKELRYEIQDTYTEIVNDLMGTDVGSFAENLVSAMVDAFKQGEDAMKVFNDKFDELIDNMIMKSLASRIVSSYIDKLWEEQEQKIKLRSTKEADELVKAKAEYDKVKNMSEREWLAYHYGTDKTMTILARAMKESGLDGEELMEYLKNLYEHRLDAVETMVNNTQKTFDDATSWTNQDTNEVISGIENLKDGLYDNLYNAISQWYTFGQDSDKNLSNLQQGLQSMSEDTANSLEAYMNGVSQQVYLQSEYLRRIAEVMTEDANPNDDIEIASLSQILLQLQQSYTVQQSIQNILEGWNNSNGQAVRVELVS